MKKPSEGYHRGGQESAEGFPRACICPNCRYEQNRSPEVPCYALKCPRCGMPMTDL